VGQPTTAKVDGVFFFERNDIALGEPYGDLDCVRRRIVGKHKALELRVALVIAADCGQNECRHIGRGILFSHDDELIEREKIRRRCEPRLRSSLWNKSCGHDGGIDSTHRRALLAGGGLNAGEQIIGRITMYEANLWRALLVLS
jgi:hypothetical protein